LLADRGFLGLSIPRDFGGWDADRATQHEYTEILAASCGVTAFTQQQLRTGIKYLVNGDNEALKRRLLPSLAAGRQFCGIAISQLRRSGDAVLRAEPVPGGYRISGEMPWITAWSLLDGFVFGANLDANQHLFAYTDRRSAANLACLEIGAPLSLAVMTASETVAVTVADLFIPDADIVTIRPAADFARNDDHEITLHAALPLGCARGCERLLRDLARTTESPEIDEAATALMFEINDCRRQALTWDCDCVAHPDYKRQALRARANAIVLALRAAHAVVTATGGRAQLATATAHRLLREAQFYTNAVQTHDVRNAVLSQLFSPLYGL
jgi:alkylation response protein AidB-like acyl-CoA dehydrogenase